MCNIKKKHNIVTRFKMNTVWGLIEKKTRGRTQFA